MGVVRAKYNFVSLNGLRAAAGTPTFLRVCGEIIPTPGNGKRDANAGLKNAPQNAATAA
jgi:hypothetical protein